MSDQMTQSQEIRRQWERAISNNAQCAGMLGAQYSSRGHAMPRVGDVVLVEWVDSSRTTDWTFGEPDLARPKHQSVGYLSHQNDEAVNVRPHRSIDRDGAEQHVGDMTIPKCCITRISVLLALETA